MLSPLIRYGGKSRLSARIVKLFPEHDRYVEPFCGAASVFYRAAPVKHALLADMDSRLINCLRVIRDFPHELQTLLSKTPYSLDSFNEAKEVHPFDMEDARRFFTLNRQSVNGLGANWGKNKGTWRYGPVEIWNSKILQLPLFSKKLQGVELKCQSFQKTLAVADRPGTVVYADPPYVHSTRRGGKPSDYIHEMTDAQHAELLYILTGHKKASVFISGYPSELYDRMLHGWKFERWQVKTSAGNHRGDGTVPNRIECLWHNA